ncbi:DUF6188 family protein [Streptomyces sp. MS19]|uniref:DUF6188 family protein n=1 Tax=Streptomyces sp. MS19 TaxID=3385972 RepID=UPI00399FE9DE
MNEPAALVGAHVSRIAVGERVRLALTAHDALGGVRLDGELAIAAEFVIRDPGGGRQVLVPGSRLPLAPVLDLFAKTVSGAAVGEDGGLEIRFDDGTCLLVAPLAAAEPWRLTATGP